MNIILLLFIIPAFAFHDLVPVCRNRQWYVLFTYAAIMGLIVILAILISLDIDIPSPAKLFAKWVTFIFGVKPEQ